MKKILSKLPGNHTGQTIARIAVEVGNTEDIKRLINHSSPINLDKKTESKKFLPAQRVQLPSGKHIWRETFDTSERKLLVQSGTVDWNESDDNEDLAIMWALKNNKYGIVEELLAVPDINLDIRDKEGWSLVFRAISTLKLGKCIFCEYSNNNIFYRSCEENTLQATWEPHRPDCCKDSCGGWRH